MALHELHSSCSDDPALQHTNCARCGKSADIHLILLKGGFHQGETFCFACGEAMMREQRKQASYIASEHFVLSPDLASVGANAHAYLHSDVALEESEGGIIFWEGHGWSSDGPFAGA